MKKLITILSLFIAISGMGQEDSLTASKFITDSIGRTYEVEYVYAANTKGIVGNDTLNSSGHHSHYIAICKIIEFKGNKQKTIASGIKAIYSPVSCSSDNEKLWLERLKKYIK